MWVHLYETPLHGLGHAFASESEAIALRQLAGRIVHYIPSSRTAADLAAAKAEVEIQALGQALDDERADHNVTREALAVRERELADANRAYLSACEQRDAAKRHAEADAKALRAEIGVQAQRALDAEQRLERACEYGVHTEETRALADTLGLREGKDSVASVARRATEVLEAERTAHAETQQRSNWWATEAGKRREERDVAEKRVVSVTLEREEYMRQAQVVAEQRDAARASLAEANARVETMRGMLRDALPLLRHHAAMFESKEGRRPLFLDDLTRRIDAALGAPAAEPRRRRRPARP